MVSRNELAKSLSKGGFFPQDYNFIYKHKIEARIQCSYCGRFIRLRSITKDHVWPKCLGGTITTPCCRKCNAAKKDKKPIEFAIWFSGGTECLAVSQTQSEDIMQGQPIPAKDTPQETSG